MTHSSGIAVSKELELAFGSIGPDDEVEHLFGAGVDPALVLDGAGYERR